MIIKTLTTEEMMSDLICDDYACWSPQGARALVNYLEQLSDDLGENIEWDRVALRCDFSEYKTMGDALEAYDMSRSCELRDSTTVIDFDGGVIVQEF